MSPVHDPSTASTSGQAENRGPALLVFIVTWIILSAFAVIGRFVARGISHAPSSLKSRFWWDDWLVLTALVMLCAAAVCLIRMIHIGLGHHTWTLPLTHLGEYFRLVFAIYALYYAGVALGRASVVAFYYRMFCLGQSRPRLRRIIYSVHVLNLLWFAGTFIANFVRCDPIAKNWHVAMPGRCLHTSRLWLAIGIPSLIIDLVILLIPLPIIWKLKLDRIRKTGLTFIFVLGYSVIVVSLTRVILSFTRGKQIDRDLSYEGVTVIYWMIAEIPITIISGCLITMLNIFRYLAGWCNCLGRRFSSVMRPHKAKSASYTSNTGTNLKVIQTDELHLSPSLLRSSRSSKSINDESEPLEGIIQHRDNIAV